MIVARYSVIELVVATHSLIYQNWNKEKEELFVLWGSLRCWEKHKKTTCSSSNCYSNTFYLNFEYFFSSSSFAEIKFASRTTTSSQLPFSLYVSLSNKSFFSCWVKPFISLVVKLVINFIKKTVLVYFFVLFKAIRVPSFFGFGF